MKTTPLALAIAGVLAAAATGASAQTYGQAYGAYQQQQATYQQQQQAYATARARYEQDKASYDARYGYGAYERRYGGFSYQPDQSYGYGYGTSYPSTSYPAQAYPYSSAPYNASPYGSPYSQAPSTYGYGYGSPYGPSAPYGYGTPAPYGTPTPYSSNPYYAGAYGANSSYGTQPCSTTSSSGGVSLSVLAALAQAALGGGSSAGSILNQAVLGAGVDSSVGSSTVSGVKCDSRGPYYSYNQTQPYREGYYDSYGQWHATATTRAYASCRIAPAPADTYGSQYRYVRVCPDSSGRYRITG